jgi:hypothetical protein
MNLAGAQTNSKALSFVASEDTSGVDGQFPGTSNCVQQAYVSSYSGGSIPFAVVNGQYVHGGSTLINPSQLSSWAQSGAQTVAQAVLQESSGAPWSVVEPQAAWVCAFIVKSNGYNTVASFLAAYPGLTGTYQWTPSMTSLVNTDLGQLS